eukprot:jgi/Hompol1/1117/HPOL_002642-RA
MYGTLIGAVVQIITVFWVITDNSWKAKISSATGMWHPSYYQTYGSAGIIWGLIGPLDFFGPHTIYHNLWYGFAVGALLPLLPWLGNKIWPSSHWKLINFPVLTFALPSAGTNIAYILPSFIIAFISQYYMFHYHRVFWAKYNYVLSIALDVGTGIASMAVGFIQIWLSEDQPYGKLSPHISDYYCQGTYEQVELG